ncbi:nuclease-related domain-containing protein [Paramicrobacterium agarici]|uniref:Nuclease-like protein n=1 Tax=Paramicrobacterium agarici TaxID=630514 RepID=A0A2A9DT77_9MICO|nr:nuclease-related domain-containing protein [Microbacterium agarici]PFG29794.1 nuclease-like protein [Microbacterium agarici]
MTGDSLPSDKQMRLRYAGTCHRCGASLPAGVLAVYERDARRVRCISCSESGRDDENSAGDVDLGTAGASARREYERRQSSREERIRKKYPKLSGVILALSDEPQSTSAWKQGAIGEELLAQRLSTLPESVRTLNDRRIAGTRANIDHIVIAPSGVWVVDAKRYRDRRPELQVTGGILRQRSESLRIGGRDGTRLVEGVTAQVAHVRNALADPQLPVTGALCFLEADWPLLGGSFVVDGVHVLWPRLLVKQIRSGPDRKIDVDAVSARLAKAFPVA